MKHKINLLKWNAPSLTTNFRWVGEGLVKYCMLIQYRTLRKSYFSKFVDFSTFYYARVSTCEKKNDLERQANALIAYCENKGWTPEVIKDIGSGLNYKKRELHKLINKILNKEISRLIITDKDRLLRFGSELIFSLCEHEEIEIIIINKKTDISQEEELVQDVLEIIQVKEKTRKNEIGALLKSIFRLRQDGRGLFIPFLETTAPTAIFLRPFLRPFLRHRKLNVVIMLAWTV